MRRTANRPSYSVGYGARPGHILTQHQVNAATHNVIDKLLNTIWTMGIRTFRLSRRMGLSVALEPAFVIAAKLIPRPTIDAVATINSGATLRMPAGYRDSRTVITGLFQADETKLFERLVVSGMSVVDLGAYVGYFTILAARLVGLSGRVFAFEPNTAAFEYLCGNIAVNHCNNVTAINKAVSNREAAAILVSDPHGPETFMLDQAPTEDATAIKTISLDSFMAREKWPKIDLIKMNIEGSEYRALLGMMEVSRRNPMLRIVMEFNPGAMERAGVTRETLGATLAGLGFRRGEIVERGVTPIRLNELLPRGRTVCNILLTK